jgi:hypothetical protein
MNGPSDLERKWTKIRAEMKREEENRRKRGGRQKNEVEENVEHFKNCKNPDTCNCCICIIRRSGGS